MLKKAIYLKDHKEESLKIALIENSKEVKKEYVYSKENIIKAVDSLIKAGLKYNTENGKVYYKTTVMSEYSNKNFIPSYEDIPEVIEWEFSSFILCSAARLERGLKAV